MHINFKRPVLHWNYFLSIEEELIATSKYVEFDQENLKTFSTEYTKIILEACSEVDVLLTQIGKIFKQKKNRPNFKDHFKIIYPKVYSLISEELFIEQYGIEISPFKEWPNTKELDWHKTYNNLKHNRGDHYKEGNLENAFLSVGALFTTVLHYYKCFSELKSGKKIRLSYVINSLTPRAKMIKFSDEKHYHITLS